MSLHPRRRPLRRIRDHLGMIAWLTIMWVLLWGTPTIANVVVGIVVAVTVVSLLSIPSVVYHGRIRPFGVVRLVSKFGWDLFVASFQVAFQALHIGYVPYGAIVGVRLRSDSDLYEVIVAALTALVPGTIVVEAHRLSRMIYIHVLDVDAAKGIEMARWRVLETERHVLLALGSDEEIEQAGLEVPRSWLRRRRAGAGQEVQG